ncbi:unnamed protein product [Chrysoparadoxa australica]
MLREMIQGKEGSTGTRLCDILKRHVAEDQGSVDDINRAVHACCASLLKHRGLSNEAFAVAEGREKPSKELLRTWRLAQKMREYFSFGDIRDAVRLQQKEQKEAAEDHNGPMPPLPIMERGPSVYEGAEEKVVSEVSAKVVERAEFLLSIPSFALQADKVGKAMSQPLLICLINLHNALTHPSPSFICSHSSGPCFTKALGCPGRGKGTCETAAAAINLKEILAYRRKVAEEHKQDKEASVAERILLFLQSHTEVSMLLRIRKLRDERSQLRAEGLSLMRQLLGSAAAPTSQVWLMGKYIAALSATKRPDAAHVHYLNGVEGCNPARSELLTQQLALFLRSVLALLQPPEGAVSQGFTPICKPITLTLSFIAALHACAIDYKTGDHELLEGSDLLAVIEPLLSRGGEVQRSAWGLIEPSSKLEPFKPLRIKSPIPRRPYFSSSNPIISQKVLLPQLGSGNSEEPSSFTGALVDLLVGLPRSAAILLLNVSDVFHESSKLLQYDQVIKKLNRSCLKTSSPFVALTCTYLALYLGSTLALHWLYIGSTLIGWLLKQPVYGNAWVNTAAARSDMSNKVCGGSPPLLPHLVESCCRANFASHFVPSYPSLAASPMELRGRTAPDCPTGLRHSFSLWLRRAKGPRDLLDEGGQDRGDCIKEGDRVVRGKDWEHGVEDGGDGQLGTVQTVEGTNINVTWDATKRSGTYRWDREVDGRLVRDLIVVDEEVGGTIYLKGSQDNLTDAEDAEPWSMFGLDLLGNGSLCYYAKAGEGTMFKVHGQRRIAPEQWTHVAVVQAKNRARLYIDGEEDAEATLPLIMLQHKVGHRKEILESGHPYPDNQRRVWEVEIPGAISYSVTFDPQTKTEKNYDYCKILKDKADEEDCWGEGKYSGGRDGSEGNWPGLGGRPSLLIPASKFAVLFVSDGSNNDWGFRLIATAHLTCTQDDDGEGISAATEYQVNQAPIYLGQCPSYVSSKRSSTGHLAGVIHHADALAAEQVSALAALPPPDEPEPQGIDEAVAVLSVIHRCARLCTGPGMDIQRQAPVLVSRTVLASALRLLFAASPRVQVMASKVCMLLLPNAPIDLVDATTSMPSYPSLPPTTSPSISLVTSAAIFNHS